MRYMHALTLVAIAVLRPALCAADDLEFKKIQLTKTEHQFLEELDALEKDTQTLLPTLVVLVSLNEVADAPKTVDDLVQRMAVERIAPKSSENFALAVRGIKQLSAKPIYEELALFNSGLHPKYKRYRPKGENLRFFKMLHDRYFQLATTGNK